MEVERWTKCLRSSGYRADFETPSHVFGFCPSIAGIAPTTGCALLAACVWCSSTPLPLPCSSSRCGEKERASSARSRYICAMSCFSWHGWLSQQKSLFSLFSCLRQGMKKGSGELSCPLISGSLLHNRDGNRSCFPISIFQSTAAFSSQFFSTRSMGWKQWHHLPRPG